MRWFAAGCALVFLLFAVVQLNDPDGVIWFIGYAAISANFVAVALGYGKELPLWLGAMLSLIVCAWYSPSIIEYLFNSDGMGMTNGMSFSYPYIEETREAFGLLIAAIMQLIAAWNLPVNKTQEESLPHIV
ncbi:MULTISPECIES: transmembrane 220 family protein [Corallincola]|uniref:Transmembrane family 220, helix n=2 Tax=Corallincola TaxID=1775176 RepID=A0ABY1WSB9_9GAMM|nr:MULTISPECIES: transmembrane 220 family protein [Corallincola]TAA47510.1 hypothetical protein EXY25_09830 [Corallincola spongiicola]TCI05192.1 hypothetical protein EZV61_04310 [Corallincola luteus]